MAEMTTQPKAALVYERTPTRATVAKIGSVASILADRERMGRDRLDIGVIVLDDDEIDNAIEIGDRVWIRGRVVR